MNIITIQFRHIPVGIEFKHGDIEYIKTNFQRGYYWKNDKRVFRKFKKHTIVKTSNEYFDWEH